MAMLQLYPDSLPDYPPECQSLYDLGFTVLPQLADSYSVLADVLVLVTIGSFILITIFLLPNPQLIIRRWLFLLASLYLLRGVMVVLTRYPRLPFKMDKFTPSNPIQGAFLIMIGSAKTATDIMYSGHTVNFVLAGSFISRYTGYGVFSFFFWGLSLTGVLALIATREHYSTDVLVAFIITKLSFWVYHLFFDSLYMRFWVSGFTLKDTGPVKLILPAKIVGSYGQEMEIEKEMVSDFAVTEALMARRKRDVKIINFMPVETMRYQLYRMLKWLDFE